MGVEIKPRQYAIWEHLNKLSSGPLLANSLSVVSPLIKAVCRRVISTFSRTAVTIDTQANGDLSDSVMTLAKSPMNSGVSISMGIGLRFAITIHRRLRLARGPETSL